MRRVFCVVVTAAVFVSNLVSAQSLPSTLLWKISGNGLLKPSYLYGTMHLTDDRIFNIGDSMYSAIEKSEGFAIEINPDDFTPFIIDETKKSILQKQRLKDVMSDRDFKKYAKPLSKRFGKNENDITTADVFREKNKWIEESYHNGKMQTFLDAYLFDVARREGKWTGGVEDMQDQEDLFNSLVDESDIEQMANEDEGAAKSRGETGVDKMMRLYMNSDLNGIEFLSELDDSLLHDKMLTKRNKKMAMRMDSLSRVRSMVFAVGAAHLPGADGLISLLKEKGFTVSPVFSSKKYKPSEYKVPAITQPWYNVTDESDFYTASMPGKAGNMAMYGVMNMKMYFDVFSSTVYMTSALHTPYSDEMADSVMGVMAGYYFHVSDFSKGKAITVNGIPGREFLYSQEKYSRGYLLHKDGMMYMAVAMTMRRKDTASEQNMNRFLNSFVIHEVSKVGETKYITYANPGKAYSVEVPAPPVRSGDVKGSEDKSIVTDLNTVIDPQTGNYLFFGTNEVTPGYFIPNDSTMLHTMREEQKNKFVSYTLDTTYVKEGRRVMELAGMMAAAPVMMKAHYEFRGNRWYALVAMYDPKKESSVIDHFFHSFTTLDYVPHSWKLYRSGDNLFTTWAPDKIEKNTTTDSLKPEGLTFKYNSFDTSRANDYSVVGETFSKYYWQLSDTAVLNQLAAEEEEDSDTLLSKKETMNGGVPGVELLVQERGASNVKRKRFLFNDNKLYTLLAIQPAQGIYDADVNQFFTNFNFTKIVPSTGLTISKAKLLIGDLLSSDSVTRAGAKSYLSSAPFSKADLPLLHNALLQTYVENEEDYRTTKEILQSVVIELKDNSSYTFAKEQYPKANEKNKNLWLNILLSNPTADHFTDVKNLLLQYPPTQKLDYSFASSLTDTLSLTATIFPGLLPLLNDTAAAPSLIHIASALLDSNYINAELLRPYSKTILDIAQQDYNRIKKDPENYDYTCYSTLDVLAALNTPAANTALQNWTTLKKNQYLRLHAAGHLLANKQPVAASVWQRLAADNSTRAQLYDTLRYYQNTALFPKEYFTQKSFAESYVFTSASDDYDPSELTYLTQKVISFKGRQSKFFFYKVTYDEGDAASYRLACAGPFPLNEKEVFTKKTEGNLYDDEDFDSGNLQVQMNALIQQAEEYFEWDDK